MQNNIPYKSIANFVEVSKDAPEDAIISRKSSDNSLVINNNEEQTCICVISSINCDNEGDVVIPTGADTTAFMKNPVCLFAHQHSSAPIGKIVELNISEKDIKAKIKFAPTDAGQEIWKLVQGGYLRASSVGFWIKRALIKGQKDFTDYVNSKGMEISNQCTRIITEFVLVENSIVPIPCQSDALMQAISTKSIHISDKLTKELGLKNIEIKDIPPVAIPIPVILDAPIVEPKIETIETIEPKPEPVVAPVVVVPPAVEPKIEPVKPIFTVVRDGPFVVDEDTLKSYKCGKIITI